VADTSQRLTLTDAKGNGTTEVTEVTEKRMNRGDAEVAE
jgi:hypothetical protein